MSGNSEENNEETNISGQVHTAPETIELAVPPRMPGKSNLSEMPRMKEVPDPARVTQETGVSDASGHSRTIAAPLASRMSALAAANLLIDEYYPKCEIAIVAGSAARGETAERSDLDLVVFDESQRFPYRECRDASGWRAEILVLTKEAYGFFYDENAYTGLATLQRMCAEGIVIRDDGSAADIIQEAADQLREGPSPWTMAEINEARYEITEYLDDLADSTRRSEQLFIAMKLADLLQTFILRINGHWSGAGKWLVRCLAMYDQAFSERFVEAFDDFFRSGITESIIRLADQVLEPHGGRLAVGYWQGSPLWMDVDADEGDKE